MHTSTLGSHVHIGVQFVHVMCERGIGGWICIYINFVYKDPGKSGLACPNASYSLLSVKVVFQKVCYFQILWSGEKHNSK